MISPFPSRLNLTRAAMWKTMSAKLRLKIAWFYKYAAELISINLNYGAHRVRLSGTKSANEWNKNQCLHFACILGSSTRQMINPRCAHACYVNKLHARSPLARLRRRGESYAQPQPLFDKAPVHCMIYGHPEQAVQRAIWFDKRIHYVWLASIDWHSPCCYIITMSTSNWNKYPISAKNHKQKWNGCQRSIYVANVRALYAVFIDAADVVIKTANVRCYKVLLCCIFERFAFGWRFTSHQTNQFFVLTRCVHLLFDFTSV